MTKLLAEGTTDPGQVRSQNQDTFYVSDHLILIADGMGGYAGGEVAAAIAAEVVGSSFGADGSATGLEDAVLDANRRIYERGVEPGLEGMGTTLVAAALVSSGGTPRVLVANVGDSRGYLLRAGTLRQLTEDHSVAAELVRMGRLEEDEGAEHPGRHVLTRALGVDREVAPDLIELDPLDGDRLLLCSDGLSNELDDDQILSFLAVGAPSDAARALVAAANAHGGLDNITAVVADVVDVPERSGEPSGPVTTAVDVVLPSDRAATLPPRTPAPPPAPGAGPRATLAVRPVLSRRDRRRRRREDRRARRAYNKWVSLRGVAFLLAFAAVLVAAYVVLRWYGTQNFVVTFHRFHHDGHTVEEVVVLQGQPGGFLWWPQHIVNRETFGPHQLPVEQVPAIKLGVQEPTLRASMEFIRRVHLEWEQATGHVATTTTLATTTSSTFTTGGT